MTPGFAQPNGFGYANDFRDLSSLPGTTAWHMYTYKCRHKAHVAFPDPRTDPFIFRLRRSLRMDPPLIDMFAFAEAATDVDENTSWQMSFSGVVIGLQVGEFRRVGLLPFHSG